MSHVKAGFYADDNGYQHAFIAKPPQLLTLPLTNGLFAFQVNGSVIPGLVIEASTNLADWVPVPTNTTTSAPLIFLDAASGQSFIAAQGNALGLPAKDDLGR